MRSAFAVFLRGFTLPFGATTGQRIEFDGVNGVIRVYDGTNKLRLRITGANSSYEAFSGDVDEIFGGVMQGLVQGVSGSTKQGVLNIESPSVNTSGPIDNRSSISLLSESMDESLQPSIDFIAETLKLNGVPIGTNIVREFSDDTTFAAVSVDTTTDMALGNCPVIKDNWYSFHLHSPWDLTAAGRWAAYLRVNGSLFDRLDETGIQTAGNDGMFDGIVYWQAPATATTDDFDVRLLEFSGAGSLSLPADGTAIRRLVMKHEGKVQP